MKPTDAAPRTILRTKQFKRDFRRGEDRSDRPLDDLKSVIQQLVAGKSLAAKFSDHPLKGKWKGYRECHVRPDWLLIYRLTESELKLVALGSHAELFGA
jgi:mRNA interferase YafQ